MAETNPYAAPKAAVDDVETSSGPQLASLGQRFAAAVIDGLIFMGAGMAAGVAAGGPALPTGYTLPMLVALAVVGAINLWTVHRYRASIGKLALKIRMVRSDGSEAELWRLVILRGLPQWVVSAIPVVNMLNLVDALFVLGKARRCVHDYIADTIVVRRA
jgi:uncharacterized RDD family membrane protein YckC